MALSNQDLTQISALLDRQTEQLQEGFASKEDVDISLNELRSEIHTYFDGLFKRLETFEQEYFSVREGVSRVEGRVDNQERRIKKLEAA